MQVGDRSQPITHDDGPRPIAGRDREIGKGHVCDKPFVHVAGDLVDVTDELRIDRDGFVGTAHREEDLGSPALREDRCVDDHRPHPRLHLLETLPCALREHAAQDQVEQIGIFDPRAMAGLEREISQPRQLTASILQQCDIGSDRGHPPRPHRRIQAVDDGAELTDGVVELRPQPELREHIGAPVPAPRDDVVVRRSAPQRDRLVRQGQPVGQAGGV